MCGPLDELKAQHRHFVLHFDAPQPAPPAVPGAISVAGSGREWTVICNGARLELPAIAARLAATIVDERSPSLNEIFVAYAGAPATSAGAAIKSNG